MSRVGETFFTIVGCMDGRIQCPVKHFGQDYFHAKYADTITEAGLVGIVSKESVDSFLLDSIKKKIFISLEKHHSKGIIVHGHEDCAGNPVSPEQQKRDIRASAHRIADLVGRSVEILSVFVTRGGETWVVEKLS